MPSQVLSSTENNFTKGLVTQFTGLNFPENAATDTNNCVYNIVGNVTRRLGFDIEDNGLWSTVSTNSAINSYKWNNVGGDGSTQVVVVQVGSILYFYRSTSATVLAPLSTTKLFSTVDLTTFGTGSIAEQECDFASGNGYLFVYHPLCQPFFCSYAAGVVTATSITVNIRDFNGVVETGVPVTDRPTTLTDAHQYNLINQGWTQGSAWTAFSTGSSPSVASSGLVSFTVAAGITGTVIGDQVSIATVNEYRAGVAIPAGTAVMSGTLSSYAGTTMTINITGDLFIARGLALGPYKLTPYNKGYINTWSSGLSNFPSNSDVWWYFKDSSNIFNPVTTINQVTVNSGNAPRGHFILNAFDQNKSVVSSVDNITSITTTSRPRTGTWFQGRVWYTGVDASQSKTGNADYYTWTENIYFSQTVVSPDQFGACHQLNDPTSETLFDLLPTDGGVIVIQGAGAIYKLFPIQNGMLVFASNGVWFITGSQGIGFAANDYTVTKISSIQSISPTSFVDVQGLPYFWNEDGIYQVAPQQGGGLAVNPITVDTILDFYESIPQGCKRYARGSYNPIDYVIQWTYRSTDDSGISDRYQFDSILNFNTYNKAFYPYSFAGPYKLAGVIYVTSYGGSAVPDPVFKYLITEGSNFSFADEHDTDYVDWKSDDTIGTNYDSYFITGYKLHGQGQKRFQVPYIYVYSNLEEPTAYKIQSVWDYATSGNSGRWSTPQVIQNNKPYFNKIFRRHRLRGQGIVLQIKVTSVDGSPFDIMGWSTYENANTGV